MKSAAGRLADLIDLEAQLGRDQTRPEAELLARDSAVAAAVSAALAGDSQRLSPERLRRKILFVWLRHLNPPNSDTPGRRFVRALHTVEAGLVVLGIVLGVATLRLVLRYDGSEPVNIVHFLAVMVAAQAALLVLAPLLWVGRRALSVNAVLGPLQELLASFVSARARIPPELLRLRRLHGKPLRWQLVVSLQRFGIAFNLAALATLIYLVTFTDIAFAWSTSLNLSSADAYVLLERIAWPWSFLDPRYLPSPELVEKTQYFRIEGRYMAAAPESRAEDVRLLGSWWPFLAMALAVYGLLPRMILYAGSRVALFKSLQEAPLDTVDLDFVYARLTASQTGFRGAGNQDIEPSRSAAKQDAASIAGSGSCHVILWRDVPLSQEQITAWLGKNGAWSVEQVLKVGGSAGDVSGQRAVTGVLAHGAAAAPILLLAEAWEAPGKAVATLLSTLRQGLGPRRPILIGLVLVKEKKISAAPHARQMLWKLEVAKLGDPYLGLAELPAPTAPPVNL